MKILNSKLINFEMKLKQKNWLDVNFDPKEKQYGRIILVLKFLCAIIHEVCLLQAYQKC